MRGGERGIFCGGCEPHPTDCADAGTFYTTVFDYASELFLLGIDAASGALVYEAPVRNPFIDLAVAP